MKCEFLPNITTPDNFKTVSVDSVLNDIKTEKYGNAINALPLASNDKKAYNEAKRHLPAWALNGEFVGSVKNYNFSESNGLFHIDIDGLDEPEAVKWQLAHEIPELHAMWISPSGKGLKGLLRIPDDLIHNDADFKNAFIQIEKYLSAYEVAIDKACKDVRRLCFVCSDSNIFINVDAQAFIFDMSKWGKKEVKKPLQSSQQPTASYQASHQDRYIDRCCNLILQSVTGNHHNARLRAGKLAGGFISAGLVNGNDIMQALSHASDSISAQYGDSQAIIQREQKTIYDAIQYGKGQPVEIHQFSRTGTDSNVISFNSSPPPPPNPPPPNHPEENESAPHGSIDKSTVQAYNPDLSSSIDYIIPFDGIAKDIQHWILETSVIKQPAIALAATLTVLGTITGRNIDYGGIKGNIMSICIAGSGHGKDHPLKCVDRLLECVGLGDRVYSRLASGAALFETVHRHPSCVLTIDEMGYYFGSINDKGANQFSKEIMPMITEMYTSADGVYRDKARKGVSKEAITAPNLMLLGMTTERQIIDAMKSSSLADGSMARFLILFGETPKELNQDFIDKTVPDYLAAKLKRLNAEYGEKISLPSLAEGNPEKGFKSTPVKRNDDFVSKCREIGSEFFNKANAIEKAAEDENAMFAPAYRRALVMTIQLCLVADQCQSVETLLWASKLIDLSITVFSAKFKHLSADNETERLVKIIERAIKEAGTDGISKRDFYNKTRQVPSHIKDGIVNELIGADKIQVVHEIKKGSQKLSTFYYWLV